MTNGFPAVPAAFSNHAYKRCRVEFHRSWFSGSLFLGTGVGNAVDDACHDSRRHDFPAPRPSTSCTGFAPGHQSFLPILAMANDRHGRKQWVAIHRKHHAKCETPDDPHSPQVLGIRKVLWEGAELYRSEALNSETMKRYGHGTPDDWLETHLYARYDQLGITLMLFVDLALFGVSGLTVWAIQLLWIPFWAAGVVNGLGHYWGYRNYEPRDASANLLPIGLIIGGEELHNNHHAFPSSAKLSNHWWEFDIGWLYIRILTILRLAHVKKIAPVPQQLPDKQAIDLDTLRAVVLGRLYVMADFGRNVVVPVLREELRKADDSRRRILRRTKGLLLREEARLDDRDRARLRSVLDMSQALCTVYEFRMSLQSLWNRTTVSHEKLLASLQDWCTQAEASGIQALQEFAQSLRGYSVRSI